MNRELIRDYLVITFGMAVVGVGVYFFLVPSCIVMGGVTGLALVLVKIFPLSISALTFILNAICLIFGFLLLGKEFGAKTVYASILLPVYLWVFEQIFPGNASLTEEFILDGVLAAMLIGVGQALLFQVNASSGGVDIPARILNQYMHIEFGKAVTLVGVVIVCSSLFVYDMRTVVIGLLTTYFNGIVVNEYIGGFTRKKRVCILTEKTDELRDYILYDLKRGVTMYAATGAYHNQVRQELVAILDHKEYAVLMEKIRQVDEHAFVTVSSVSEVAGAWNRNK